MSAPPPPSSPTNKYRLNISAFGFLTILVVVLLIMQMLTFAFDQFASLDIKRIAQQNNDTANNTNALVKSDENATRVIFQLNKIIREMRDLGNQSELNTFVYLNQSLENQEKIMKMLNSSSS